MEEDPFCSKCGARLISNGASRGLCPQCLLKLGLNTPGNESVAESQSQSPAEPKHEGDPTTIGPYRILESLGEGGMGIVYLAEQVEPIRRRVALKIIKPGMDTREVLARFEVERQALAVMSHPNIAKVFDAGVTEQGRSYFVMEYVPGIRITEYCDMRCLSVRERLELFKKICEAIQHAHQKGIIHRDVKPSNVLVASEDGKPVPKIIDFGLAKAIGPQLTEKTLFTRQGVLIGTPEYMSPEQAGKTALDVDARTDIYSLGVLLYELLVGALPFDPSTFRQAAAVEMLRIIQDEDPPRPAIKFSSLGNTSPEVARKRHTDVGSLTRQLRGELEWITMRAMEKAPGRRYPSASELAADVTRYLADEPVLAGPPGRAYRLKKLLRKHRAAIIAVAVSFTILLAASVISTVLFMQSESARERAEMETHRSMLEAEAIQAVLLNDGARYKTISREAMRLHRSLLEKGGSDLALYMANRLSILQETIEDDILNEEDKKEREELRRETVALVNRALDRGDPGAVRTAALIAGLLTPEEVAPLVKRALAVNKNMTGKLDQRIPEGMDNLLERLFAFIPGRDVPGDDEAFEEIYREWLARFSTILPAKTASLVKAKQALAAILGRKGSRSLRTGDPTAAAQALREAVDLIKGSETEPSERIAKLQSDLAASLMSLNQFSDAERLLLEAIPALEKTRGTNNAATHVARNRLANVYTASKRSGESKRILSLQPGIFVEAVSDLGPLRFDPNVIRRDFGHSGLINGKSVWLFGSTTTARPGGDGLTTKQSTIAWTDTPNAANGLSLLDGVTDSTGVPVDMLPLNRGDAEFNRTHNGDNCIDPCDTRWFLEPGAVVADTGRNRLLVFYRKMLQRPSEKKDRVGTWLAVWNPGASKIELPKAQRQNKDTVGFFGPDEPAWGSAALVISDWMYAYGCETQGLGCTCLLARVPLASALDRSAWQFFNANGRWSSSWKDAQPVLQGGIQSGILSVHWNPFLGKFLAVCSRVLDARIDIRVADRPEGPWSDAVIEADTLPSGPTWTWTNWGLGHPEFSRDGGRTEYVTYWRNVPNYSEIRLMEIRFGKK